MSVTVFAPGVAVEVRDGEPAVPPPSPGGGAVVVYTGGASVEVRDIPPQRVDIQSRPLNLTATLQFRHFNGDGRYLRYIKNVILTGIAELQFLVTSYTTDSPPLQAQTYELLCDGVVVATDDVSGSAGEFVFNTASLAPGWHLFDIRPTTPTFETAHPMWMHVGAQPVPGDIVPTQTGSWGINHEERGTAYWGTVPRRADPPAFTLAPRTPIPFSTTPTPASLYRRNLSPCWNGDIQIAHTQKSGLVSCLNGHAYAFANISDKFPDLILRDGPFGAGTLPSPTHLQVGRSADYFTDPWRVGKIHGDGRIQTLAGYRHGPNGREQVGDWSAIPVERHGFHELWGMAWHTGTLGQNTSAPQIPNPVTPEPPHLPTARWSGPTAFVPDSQNNRVCAITFDPASHETPAKITEFIPGLADPWDCVIGDGVLYVSERKANRVSAWDADTGQFIRVVVEGPAGLAIVDSSHRVNRIASLTTIRLHPCIAPEGLYFQDGWLYFGSIAMAQVKRVHATTGELQLVCQWSPISKSEYCKFAVSDGTFGPRGSVFISTWEVNRMGAPWAFKPDGTGWAIVTTGSHSVPHGKGGKWEGIGYSTACAVGNGRLLYGGADYGLCELTLAQAGDAVVDEAMYAAGLVEYQRAGYRLSHGINGFRQWRQEPLPWGKSAAMDYYLTQHGHTPG